MPDPFQNVDAAGPEFVAYFADVMDVRQSEPVMEEIVRDYLAPLTFGPGSLTVEIGCGAGAVSRRIADHAAPGMVRAFDPSSGFVGEARNRANDRDNLAFDVADGAALPVEDEAADHVVIHTVLTHTPDPAAVIAEAARVLRPGGILVVCDSDFSKGTLGSAPNDPLAACSGAFVSGFVTDPHITGKLRPMALEAGFVIESFALRSRVVTGEGMVAWVKMPAQAMVERGEIGQPLADALCAEYERRMEAGTLYGYQAFVTMAARKPA